MRSRSHNNPMSPREADAGQTTVPERPQASLADRVAFLISALASPFLVLPFFTLALIRHYSPNIGLFLWWSFIAIAFTTGIPLLYILLMVRLGTITDVHVRLREQRRGPFLISLFSSALGTLALHQQGAPLPLIVMGAGIVCNGIAFALITLRWKISMHPSVFTASVVSATFLIDPRWVWLLCLLPLVVWARVQRTRHSLPQGIAAIILATIVTLCVLAAFDCLGGCPR